MINSLNTNDNELLRIGKPCAYHDSVDPNHRIGNFLRSRMSVIDLIPCTYKLDFSKATDESTDSSGLVPQINYDAMDDYKKTCQSYGLNQITALRLYTTDDTQASDSIQNTLKDNYFQSGLNAISEKVSPIQDFMRSIDKNFTQDAVDKIKEKAKGSGVDYDLGGAGAKLLDTAVDVIAKGHRISLPSIWSNSQYTPNFQAVIKLASPYGDVKAIKEFIIKPLMYLLILASPKTTDGVSYGNPYNLTIKAYGLNYSPIGMISNITLRRGGNDSSYNIFRQPLSIDVSLDFQYLVNGFAHYDHTKNIEEQNLFASSDQFETFGNTSDTALPTIGHIITSLKPKQPENDINYTNYYSNMKAARNTKESIQDSGLSSLEFNTQQFVSSFSADKFIAENTKILSDKTLINENISSLATSFQDDIHPDLNDIIV
jgi:hypothetical protein